MAKHEPYARVLIDRELEYSGWDILNQKLAMVDMDI